MSAVVSAPASGGWCIPPSGRGQAVPDPSGPEGREPRGEAMGMVVGRSARWSMHATDVAAPAARRARQRLAPTQVGQHAGGGIGRPGGGG